MTKINATVAQTSSNMVDFGGDAHEALIALCAALFAIVIWATAADVYKRQGAMILSFLQDAVAFTNHYLWDYLLLFCLLYTSHSPRRSGKNPALRPLCRGGRPNAQ